MQQVPSQLQGIFVLRSGKDPEKTTGFVRCPCGHTRFRLSATADGPGLRPTSIETDEGSKFCVVAQCARCSKTHVIFDAALHGYNAVLCPELGSKPAKPAELQPWECPKCKAAEHELAAAVSYSLSWQEFLDENDGDVPIEQSRWADCFDWITLAVACGKCGMKHGEWVSYETM